MLSFCIFIASARSEGLPTLSRASPPEFKELGDEMKYAGLEGRVFEDIQVEDNLVGTARHYSEYFLCSICVKDAVFHKNWGFGAGNGPGNGGAMLISFCTLLVTYEQKNADGFKENKAVVGGALCSLYSNVYINNTVFRSNVAFRFGGSIYFQGYETRQQIGSLSLQCVETDFIENTCFDVGGAVLITNTFSSYFDGSRFDTNKAGISGGAIYSINSQARLFDTSFISNEAGDREIRTLRSEDGKIAINNKIALHFRGVGGGAITFISSDIYRGKRQNRQLYTQGCCFLGNRAHNGMTFSEEGGAAHVILFDGLCAWYSFDDYLGGGDPKNAVAHISKQWKSTLFQARYNETIDACDAYDYENYPPINDPPMNTTVVKPVRTVGEEVAASVPAPTSFTLQATPVWDEESYSMKPVPTTVRYPAFEERTVKRTPKPTRNGTPEKTTFYPKRTPRPTKPSRTPVRSPDASPFASPHMSPMPSPVASPFRTPEPSPLPPRTFMPTPDTPMPTYDMRYDEDSYSRWGHMEPTVTTTDKLTYTKITTDIDGPIVTRILFKTSTVSDTYITKNNGSEVIKVASYVKTFIEQPTFIASKVKQTLIYVPIISNVKSYATEAWNTGYSTKTSVLARFSSITFMETKSLIPTLTNTNVPSFSKIKCPKLTGKEDWHTVYKSAVTTTLTYVQNNDKEIVLKYVPDTVVYMHQHMVYKDKCEDVQYFTKVDGTKTNTIINTYVPTNMSTYTYLSYPRPTHPPIPPSSTTTHEYLITSTRISLIPSSVYTYTASYVEYTTVASKDTITEIILPSVVFTNTFTDSDGTQTYKLTGVNVFTNVPTFVKSGSTYVEYSKTHVSQSTNIETLTQVTNSYYGMYGSSVLTNVTSSYYTTKMETTTYTFTELEYPIEKLPTKTNVYISAATPTNTFTYISFYDKNGSVSTTVSYTYTNVYSYKQTRTQIFGTKTTVLTKIDCDKFVTFLPSTTVIETIGETPVMYPKRTPLPTAVLPTPNTLMYEASYTNSYIPQCKSTFVEVMTALGTTNYNGYTGVYIPTSVYSSTFVKKNEKQFTYTQTLVPEMTLVPTKTNGIITLYTKEFTYVNTCFETMVNTKSNILMKEPVYTITNAKTNTFSSCAYMGTITEIHTYHKFKKYTFVDVLTKTDTYLDTVIFTDVNTYTNMNGKPTYNKITTVVSTSLPTQTLTNTTTFISSLGYHMIWTEAKTNTNVCMTTMSSITSISSSYTLMKDPITTFKPPMPTKNILAEESQTYSTVGVLTNTFFDTYVKTMTSVVENPTVINTETAMYLSTWTNLEKEKTVTRTYTLVSPVITETIVEFGKDVKTTKVLIKTMTRAPSIVESITKVMTDIDMKSFVAGEGKTSVANLVCKSSTSIPSYFMSRVEVKAGETTINYIPSLVAISTFTAIQNSYTYTFTHATTFKPNVFKAKEDITTFLRIKSNVQTSTCVESFVETNTVTWFVKPAPTRTPLPPSFTPKATYNKYASPSFTDVTSEVYTDVYTYSIGTTNTCFRRGNTNVPFVENVFSSTWTFINGAKGPRTYKFTEIQIISDTYTSMLPKCTDIPTYTIVSTVTYTNVPSKTETLVITGTNLITKSVVQSRTEVLRETDVVATTKTYSFVFNNPASYATKMAVFTGTYTDVVGTRSFTYTWTNSYTMTETTYSKVPTNTVIDSITTMKTKTYTDSYTSVNMLTIIIKELPSRTAVPTKLPPPPRTALPVRTARPGQKIVYSTVYTSFSTTTNINTNYSTITLTKTSTILNGEMTQVIVPTSKITYGLSEIYTITVGNSQVAIESVEWVTEGKTGSVLVVVAASVSGIILVVIVSLLIWFFVGYSKSSSSSDTAVNLDEVSLLHVPTEEQEQVSHDNPLWASSVMGENDDPFRNDFEEVTAEGFFNERAETVDSDT